MSLFGFFKGVEALKQVAQQRFQSDTRKKKEVKKHEKEEAKEHGRQRWIAFAELAGGLS